VLAHEFLQGVGGFGVQAHERLIHDDELRRVDQGADEGQFLLHAVGIAGDGLCQILRQFKQLGVLMNARFPVGLGHAENVGNEIEIFDAREKLVQVRIVGNVGQYLLAGDGIPAKGRAVDGDLAGVEGQNTAAGLDGGGFTCPVVADKAVDLAGEDVERQVVHGLLFSVGFGQMLDFQHSSFLLKDDTGVSVYLPPAGRSILFLQKRSDPAVKKCPVQKKPGS